MDPSVAAWLVSPDMLPEAASFTFEPLLSKYLKTSAPKPDTFFSHSKSTLVLKEMKLILSLHAHVVELVKKDGLMAAYVEQEMPLAALLSIMELDGIAFDLSVIAETKPRLLVRILRWHESSGSSLQRLLESCK